MGSMDFCLANLKGFAGEFMMIYPEICSEFVRKRYRSVIEGKALPNLPIIPSFARSVLCFIERSPHISALRIYNDHQS